MKTLHGKRHIRARESLMVGRQKKQLHKLNRLSDNLGNIARVTLTASTYTEEFVKVWNTLTSRFYQGVTDNGDGTYTHTWNFIEKG